ncbi:hypothetical protein JHK87_008432 [Glycine soja]|nr:hypothetical protein JHK87_008432 [Glycine soja]
MAWWWRWMMVVVVSVEEGEEGKWEEGDDVALRMVSNETEGEGGYNKKSSRWIATKSSSCLFILFSSLLISIAGGSMLGFWLHKYHPSNTQLWMVPFGFLLFLTPLFICLSVIIPDLCVPRTRIDQDQAFKIQDHPLTLPSIQ